MVDSTMKRRMKCALATAMVLVGLLQGTASAAPMTKEQGDAILSELREIKQLLAKQATQQAPQQVQAAVNPRLATMSVKAEARYVLGDSKAPLTLIAFTDFQCPFCAQFEANTFPEIKKKYIDTGKLRFILHDLPLNFHPFAIQAAQSVRCAGEQGKYWEMKDVVFGNQNKIDVDSLVGYAKGLSLNEDALKKCMTDGTYLQEIADDAKYARSLGVSGTPTFVLGKTESDVIKGQVIVGAQPLNIFEGAIVDMLRGF